MELDRSDLERSEVDRSRPFTFAAGLEAGWTRRQLRACTRLTHGVLLAPETPVTGRTRALGALLGMGSDAYVSHGTAARLMGLPIPDLPGEHVTVFERRERRRRTGRTCHVRPMSTVVTFDGVRASAPAQLWTELEPMLGLVDHVVLGDDLLRRQWVRIDGLDRDRRAFSSLRAGVDSPMESRMRMLLQLGGLPEPEVNPARYDDFGHPVRYYDLFYRASRTAIEYDGRHHITREEQWERDLGRREQAEDDGDRIVVLTAADVYRTPGKTLERVQQILRARGEPAVPKCLDQSWRRHFGG